MIHMPDRIVLAQIMTSLDLGIQKGLHLHDEGYESDNDHGQPAQVMRPVCIYSVLTTEASFNPADY